MGALGRRFPGSRSLFAAYSEIISARKPAKARLICALQCASAAYIEVPEIHGPSNGFTCFNGFNGFNGFNATNTPETANTAHTMSELRIKPFDFQAAVARAGLRPDGLPRSEEVGGAQAGSFRTAMTDALKGVSQNQFQAERLQRELTLDNPTVSLEQTVMAMQKAQIGFQAALQVRNRFAQAYSDIMNMQV